jgi:hypothetical protein
MPLQPHCPPSFYLISPEAYLLTGHTNINKHVNINTTAHKSGQRPAGKRGPGCFACGWKDFSGLIFWLLLDQAKSNSLSRGE